MLHPKCRETCWVESFTMKIKFRGKTLNITNELKGRRDFLCHWNMYIVEIEKIDDFEPYLSYSVSRNDMFIETNDLSAKTHKLSEVVQTCFDLIDDDIDDMEEEAKCLLSQLQTLKAYRKSKCPCAEECKFFE